ncbi:MAG: hypothetical protein ACLRXC_04670 [[Clostridium] leptum]
MSPLSVRVFSGAALSAGKFGRMATVGYNVDSFGHNGALPQILKSRGSPPMSFFVPAHMKRTCRRLLWWRPTTFPRSRLPDSLHLLFLAARAGGSYSPVRGGPEKENLQSFMCFYGVGNHGGGPTIKSLDYIRSIQSEVAETENVALTFASPRIFNRFKPGSGFSPRVP